jgi:hypothetical protein
MGPSGMQLHGQHHILLPGLAVGDIIRIKDSEPRLRRRAVEDGRTSDEIMWCSK